MGCREDREAAAGAVPDVWILSQSFRTHELLTESTRAAADMPVRGKKTCWFTSVFLISQIFVFTFGDV